MHDYSCVFLNAYARYKRLLTMHAEHADFDGIEHLALVLGSEIVSTFDDPTTIKLGSCKLIEEIMIGEDKLIRFSGAHTA